MKYMFKVMKFDDADFKLILFPRCPGLVTNHSSLSAIELELSLFNGKLVKYLDQLALTF